MNCVCVSALASVTHACHRTPGAARRGQSKSQAPRSRVLVHLHQHPGPGALPHENLPQTRHGAAREPADGAGWRRAAAREGREGGGGSDESTVIIVGINEQIRLMRCFDRVAF